MESGEANHDRWTMQHIMFSMGLQMTKGEMEAIEAPVTAVSHCWSLVNDYFSWEKEWKNYQANDCQGEVINAVYLFMKWNNVDAKKAKNMVRSEIMARELKYCDLKAAHLSRGNVPEKVIYWFGILDLITSGNFIWSMTTARYNTGAEDAYPGLRAAYHEKRSLGAIQDFTAPIGSQWSKSRAVKPKKLQVNEQGTARDSNLVSKNGPITPPTSPGGSSPQESLEGNEGTPDDSKFVSIDSLVTPPTSLGSSSPPESLEGKEELKSPIPLSLIDRYEEVSGSDQTGRDNILPEFG